MPTTPLTHLDVNLAGTETPTQYAAIKQQIFALISNPLFSGTSFYLKGQYIGGRPNDRG